MKLLILDGNSVANKAFYGVHLLTSPSGIPTNAIQGFINILIKLTNEIKPDAVCVTFDLKGPTFRHKFADYYKANRHPMPDDLSIQMPIIKNVLNKMGINIYEIEGFEADDVLGTASKICEDNDWECYIATGDRDSFQLLSEKTNVCFLGKDTIVYNPDKFKEEYGFEPINLIDYKAIAGDSSDNYPGVPGIGDKGARELISKYAYLDNVYEHLDEQKPGIKNKLIENKNSAYDSKFLAEISRNIPISFLPSDNIWNYNFTEGLYELLKELGFYKLIEKWNLKPSYANVLENEVIAEEIPSDVFITSDLKNNIDNIPKGYKPFDTTIAQYLINPLLKNYSSDVSYNQLNSKIHDLGMDNLYYNIELPLCSVLHKMENRGFLVDRDSLDDFNIEITDSISVKESQIYNYAGERFNINSPKQLAEILFDKIGLPENKKRSTNIEILESLSGYHPIINDIIEYRTLTKLKGTYCDGLIKEISSDGRIHTNFQQTVTATGRLSSTEPNLQNIPVRKQIGSKIRSMFVASPGNILIDADYSQIELRLLAHMSNDKNMIADFNSGYDFHTLTASKVFCVDVDQVTPEMRSKSKAINFGIIYGMSAFSLAKDINSTTSEAKRYIEAYFNKYKEVESFLNEIVTGAQNNGYVSTLFGRRRPLPELASSNFLVRESGKRMALNMPIQGTAADIIKMAMIDFDKKYNGMILQVHDELIVECPENMKDEVSTVLKESMENVVKLSVPLTVDIGTGHSWSEAH